MLTKTYEASTINILILLIYFFHLQNVNGKDPETQITFHGFTPLTVNLQTYDKCVVIFLKELHISESIGLFILLS